MKTHFFCADQAHIQLSDYEHQVLNHLGEGYVNFCNERGGIASRMFLSVRQGEGHELLEIALPDLESMAELQRIHFIESMAQVLVTERADNYLKSNERHVLFCSGSGVTLNVAGATETIPSGLMLMFRRDGHMLRHFLPLKSNAPFRMEYEPYQNGGMPFHRLGVGSASLH